MIDVSKLTIEQLKKASMEFNRSRDMPASFRAAAVYLQVPWDEPTEEEWEAAREVVVGGANPVFSACRIAKEFVRSRNAALLPQPVDPRIENLAAKFRAEFQMNNGNESTASIETVLAEIAVKELLG